MTISDWLQGATRKLKTAGIGTARLDALVLLEDATTKDRAYLLAHPETPLQGLSLQQGQTLQRLDEQIERRINHEPLAYIRGKTEFYGREFIVNKHVLEPRPESETMIELLCHLELVERSLHSGRDDIVILDVGTGSGALAVTAKLELPRAKVIATDIDPKCLTVARQNAKKHRINVKFFQGDLLEPLITNRYQLTAILANLPYVPDTYTINQAAAMEPRQAIFGGPDGLDLYRQFFGQLNRGDTRTQFVLTEALPMQHKALVSIAHKTGFRLQKTDDFIQVFAKI